jgi:hypothetical protein
MFPRRYYAGRMFAARYFPQSQGTGPAVREFPTTFRVTVSQLGVPIGRTIVSRLGPDSERTKASDL